MYKIKNMKLKDQNSKEVEAGIKPIQKEKMPLKKNGWNFNWRELAKSKNKRFYALLVDNKVEGMISLEIQGMGAYKLLFCIIWKLHRTILVDLESTNNRQDVYWLMRVIKVF